MCVQTQILFECVVDHLAKQHVMLGSSFYE